MTWCLNYWHLKNQFIYERNILVHFRAGHKEIFQNKSNEISKFSSVIHKKQTQAEYVSLFIASIDLYGILILYTKINACLRFDFKKCSEDDIPVYAEIPCNDYFVDDREVDAIDNTEQIFDFLDVPSFVSIFSGNQNEPLYLVKVTEKGTVQKDLTDPYAHFIGNGERFLKGFYLKLSRSKHISKKKFHLLLTPIVFAPDEVFDTYLEITEDLNLDAQQLKRLIQRANSFM